MLKNPASKYRPFAPVRPDGPHLARRRADAGRPIWCSVDLRDGNQALIEPMDIAAQAAHVRDAGGDRLQGDRGRLPLGLADRIRLRAQADRGRPDARRRDDPGADPGARAADPPHLRVAAGRQARDRAPVQRHRAGDAPGGAGPGRGRHRRTRDQPGAPVQGTGRASSPTRDWTFQYSPEMFSGTELRLRQARGRCGHRGLAADARSASASSTCRRRWSTPRPTSSPT